MKNQTKAFIFILMVSTAVTIAYLKANAYKEYADADKKMAQAVEMKENAIKSPPTKEPDKNTEGNKENKKALEEEPYLYDRIGFDKISGVLPEKIAGWLYIPGTNVDYVVMRGDDPTEWLWKDPYGESSSTGSLFLFPDNENDDHQIVYGHRLKDHSLYFGELLKFQDSTFVQNHQVAYFYRKESVEKYSLCCVVNGLETDLVYLYPFQRGTPEYELLIEDIEEKAETIQKTLDQDKKMLVLSTCSGKRAREPNRLYLVFQIEEVKEYEQDL